MVKITIKKKDLPVSGSEESEENDSGASDEESNNSRNSFSARKAGRSKRKCVVNFEKKKAKTLRPSKSRSKSVTPENDDDNDDEDEEDEEEEMELEEKQPKQMFSCDLCSKAFHSKFMMRTHLKAHKKVEENSKCDKYYHYYLNSLN